MVTDQQSFTKLEQAVVCCEQQCRTGLYTMMLPEGISQRIPSNLGRSKPWVSTKLYDCNASRHSIVGMARQFQRHPKPHTTHTCHLLYGVRSSNVVVPSHPLSAHITVSLLVLSPSINPSETPIIINVASFSQRPRREHLLGRPSTHITGCV